LGSGYLLLVADVDELVNRQYYKIPTYPYAVKSVPPGRQKRMNEPQAVHACHGRHPFLTPAAFRRQARDET
jgi:purine nucleoside phosphorylase